MNDTAKQISAAQIVLRVIFVFIVVAVLIGVLFGPVGASPHKARQSATMQQAHALGLLLLQYANDHGGEYPETRSSTEVLQHLIDEKYIDDPAIAYAAYANIPGKTRSTSAQLRPENVCWDITCCPGSPVADGVPAVLLTGYRIKYEAGAAAIPVTPPAKVSWYNFLFEKNPDRYIAVFYTNITSSGYGRVVNSAMIRPSDENGTIPNFIPADFDPKGKIYRQLTP